MEFEPTKVNVGWLIMDQDGTIVVPRILDLKDFMSVQDSHEAHLNGWRAKRVWTDVD